MRTALLVPAYNAVRFLPRLRAQVDRMTTPFDEVLLADDASADGTAAAAEAQGFRVLRLPQNRGPGGARNALAAATRAEWIHFHDIDDEIAPDYLAQTGPLIQPGVDAIFHWVDFIREDSRAREIRWSFDPARLEAEPARTLLLGPMPTMSSLLRREAFKNIGGFDEKHRCFEDGDLHFRLAASGARIRGLSAVLEVSLRHGHGAGANQRYCLGCRVEYLKAYAEVGNFDLREAIGAEAERAAAELYRLGDRVRARQAVAFCRELGRKVPSTRHPVLRLLRALLPGGLLLELQGRFRHRQR